MGLMRLSRTGIAKKPFYAGAAGISLWSVEELCFFLANNLPLIDADIAGTRMTRWLTEEFHMTPVSLRMEKELREGRGLSGFLSPLFVETGYYTQAEMKVLAARLSALESAPQPERYRMKADALTRNRKYGEAEQYYHLAEETADPSDRKFLALVTHNCGVAAARMLEYGEALKEFRKALEYDDSVENRETCLTALRLMLPEKKFMEAARELRADEEMIRRVDTKLFEAMEKKFPEPEDPAEEVVKLRREYHSESGT